MEANPVQSFIEITGADQATAEQNLTEAHGNLETAIDIYFNKNSNLGQINDNNSNTSNNDNGKKQEDKRLSFSIDDIQSFQSEYDPVSEIFKNADLNNCINNIDDNKTKAEVHILTIWANGIQIDDEKFRPNDDPETIEFIDDFSKGKIPNKLFKSQAIDLVLSDKRAEDYNEQTAKDHNVIILEKNNMTKINVRLPDQQEVILCVDIKTKISELIQMVKNVRKDLKNIQFVAMTTFPIRELPPDSTLECENLINALIVLK